MSVLRIRTQVEIYSKIWPEPLGCAIGKSLGLSLSQAIFYGISGHQWLVIRLDSSPNTDTVQTDSVNVQVLSADITWTNLK